MDFEIKGNTLIKYNGTAEEVIIPDNVTEIAEEAFSIDRRIKQVRIPEGVTQIGEKAFYLCKGLKEITIPSGVTTISRGAFNYCSKLTKVTIPDSVLKIGDSAFTNCKSLSKITIPSGVTEVGSAFDGCSKLKKIVLPDGITQISGATFNGCIQLTEISIPDSVTLIGRRAFYGCSRLQNITIPKNIVTIEYAAFCGCHSLTDVTIPDGAQSIGSKAFAECGTIETLNLPDSISEIADDAFADTNIAKLICSEKIKQRFAWQLPGEKNQFLLRYRKMKKIMDKVVYRISDVSDNSGFSADECSVFLGQKKYSEIEAEVLKAEDSAVYSAYMQYHATLDDGNIRTVLAQVYSAANSKQVMLRFLYALKQLAYPNLKADIRIFRDKWEERGDYSGMGVSATPLYWKLDEENKYGALFFDTVIPRDMEWLYH